MKADSAIDLDLSTVCITEAKSAWSLSPHSTAQEHCVIRRSMHTLRGKCLWVPHDGMIADVLRKRHGNSVTMLKFFETGLLSIVHEEEELPNRHNYLGKNMVVTCGCTDSTKIQLDGRPMPNNGRQLDVQKRFRKNQNGRLAWSATQPTRLP